MATNINSSRAPPVLISQLSKTFCAQKRCCYCYCCYNATQHFKTLLFVCKKKTFSFFPPSPKMDFASTPSLIDFQTTFIIIAFFSYLHNWLTWQHNTTKVVSTNPKRVFHKIFWNYNCAIQIGDVSSRSFKTSTFCCILNLSLIKESLLSFHLYFVTKLDVKKVFSKTLSI